MMSRLYTIALFLQALIATTKADCSTFTISSTAYPIPYSNVTLQPPSYQASQALWCTNGNSYGDPIAACHAPDCTVGGSIPLTITALSNISSLASSDLSSLASSDLSSIVNLVGKTLYPTSDSSTAFPYSGRSDDLSGDGFCIRNGTGGYVTFTPTLNCVNGTLS